MSVRPRCRSAGPFEVLLLAPADDHAGQQRDELGSLMRGEWRGLRRGQGQLRQRWPPGARGHLGRRGTPPWYELGDVHVAQPVRHGAEAESASALGMARCDLLTVRLPRPSAAHDVPVIGVVFSHVRADDRQST